MNKPTDNFGGNSDSVGTIAILGNAIPKVVDVVEHYEGCDTTDRVRGCRLHRAPEWYGISERTAEPGYTSFDNVAPRSRTYSIAIRTSWDRQAACVRTTAPSTRAKRYWGVHCHAKAPSLSCGIQPSAKG